MQQNTRTRGKKHLLLLFLSWLVTRLWWSIELSRLAILRARSRPVIQRVAQDKTGLPQSKWAVCDRTLYCLTVNDAPHQMFVTRMSPLSVN